MGRIWDGEVDTARPWGSGPWRAEVRGDELADLRWNGRLVLRSVRAVVRDRDWNTAAVVVDGIEETADGLTLAITVDDLGARLHGRLRIGRAADGTDPAALVVALDLVADAPLRTNRTGLVVLHPPECAGTALAVEHPDGRVESTPLPRLLSPHQPVVDIAALAWRANGVDATARFDGDVFEMEDQRNWTDASYKTYSRPLSLPFPYAIAVGEHVRQSVTVTATAADPDAETAAAPARDRIVLVAGGTVPAIAPSASTAADPPPTATIPAAAGAALLVELDLETPNWLAALARAAAEADRLDVRLVVPADDPAGAAAAAIDAAVEAVAALGPGRVRRIAAFGRPLHTSDGPTVAALRAALRRHGVATEVLGGSRAHATELGRERHLVPDDVDGLVFSLTPLFHSVGTDQLVESVAMQRVVVASVLADARGIPVHVGPVTLRPRFNDVATGPQPGPTRSDLAEGYGAAFGVPDEPRQRAGQLAAWAVASAAALAVPGVASIAMFERWGPRGVIDADGGRFPVAAAMAALGAIAGAELLTGDSPDGLLWAIGGRRGSHVTVLVANLDDRDRPWRVAVDGAPGGAGTAPTEHTGSLAAGAWTAFEAAG